ncbi:hypothetical protein Tco_0097039 [Tanacetum coccineum]
MESLNSNFQEREMHQLQQMQDKAKESCMVSFQLLHSHLKALSNNDLKGTCINGGFERAFTALFDQDVQTFTCSMLLNLDQLEQQLVKEEFQETGSMDAFRVLKTQFQTESILERAKHKREKDRRVNDRMMQSKERKDNSSKALDADLVVTESNETESERHVLSSRSGNDTHTDDADINSYSEQSESVYDTYLLEKIDRNTTPESTDMSHRGGEIDQNANAKKCQVELLVLVVNTVSTVVVLLCFSCLDFCCLKKGLEDKILVPIPDLSQRPLKIEKICLDCGDPIHGLYCRQCALIRKTLEEVFQDFQDTSKSSNDSTNFVNQEPFVVKQDPGVNSSQIPSQTNHNCCYECGDSLDDIFCRRCTCKSCGKGAHYGYNCPPQIPIISNPEPCYNQNLNGIPQNLQSLQQQCLFGTCQQCGCNEYDGVCFYCTVGNGTPVNFSTPYSSNDSPSFVNHLPQNFQNFQQQYSCCENCGGPHETYQCQPMNVDYYHEQNSCYDYNSCGFDQFQPPQYTVNHPIFNAQNELLNSQNEFLNSSNKLMEQMTTICDLVGQAIQKKEEEKRIAEEQAAKDRYWKIPICYDDDEDDTIAITPVLPIEESVNSLSMGDKHLDTIPETESDEFIKSSVEDLVPIPSESEGIPDKMCDVPLCENTTPLNALNKHSEIVVNSDNDNSSSDDDSPYDEDIDYVNASPPDVEIVSVEGVEIVIPEVGGIDTDVLLTIKDDILREKLLNVNLLIANIRKKH